MKVRMWDLKLGAEEMKEVEDVVKSNFLGEGPKTRQFEEEIARLCGVKHCVSVTGGGGVALFIAMKAVGVGEGDEVVMPVYQHVSLANSAILCGAKQIFVDCYAENGNIIVDDVEKAITEKTTAIAIVHNNGRYANTDKILKIAGEHHIPVIEDACQALASRHGIRHIGSEGTVGCLSFHPTKLITAGQGGAVITNDDGVYESVCRLKDYGRFGRGKIPELPDHYTSWGLNFRFSDLQAAVGLAQLKKIDQRARRAKQMYRRYAAELGGERFITMAEDEVPWVADMSAVNPALWKSRLAELGVASALPYKPLHFQPIFRTDQVFENAIKWSERSVWLPMHPYLTDEEQGYVIESVKKVSQLI